MRTEIEAVAVSKMGDGAAAEDPAALENRHGTAGASQIDGCRQSRHPAADDHDSLCHRKANGNAPSCARRHSLWQNARGSIFEPGIVVCKVRQACCRSASPYDEVQACVPAK